MGRGLFDEAEPDDVMICGPRPPNRMWEAERGRSLWGDIASGDWGVPDWLEPVPRVGAFAVYRIRPWRALRSMPEVTVRLVKSLQRKGSLLYEPGNAEPPHCAAIVDLGVGQGRRKGSAGLP